MSIITNSGSDNSGSAQSSPKKKPQFAGSPPNIATNASRTALADMETLVNSFKDRTFTTDVQELVDEFGRIKNACGDGVDRIDEIIKTIDEGIDENLKNKGGEESQKEIGITIPIQSMPKTRSMATGDVIFRLQRSFNEMAAVVDAITGTDPTLYSPIVERSLKNQKVRCGKLQKMMKNIKKVVEEIGVDIAQLKQKANSAHSH